MKEKNDVDIIQPIKKKKWGDIVVEELIRVIMHKMDDGDKLPSERELMIKLDIGRSSLREALRSLEVMGLVETRTGDGTFVTKEKGKLFQKPIELGVFDNLTSTKELIEARTVIEGASIDLVVKRITKEELDLLDSTVEEMEKCGIQELEAFISADKEFHRVLLSATKNRILSETINLSNKILEKERVGSIRSLEEMKKSAGFHRDILERLKEKDVVKAEKAMLNHMKWTKNLLLRNK